MPPKKTFSVNTKSFTLFSILLLIVLAPVVVYVATFGILLSKTHSVWSEFGSAMSGIYAPMIALATLCVLTAQLNLQKQLYLHETDLAIIHQARTDIEFYCTQLAKVMDRMIHSEESIRAFLHGCFQPNVVDELDDEKRRESASKVHSFAPESVDLWSAILPILGGLSVATTVNYQMTLNSSKQKLVAILSLETCVCLDNLHRIRTEGRTNIGYSFRPLLSK